MDGNFKIGDGWAKEMTDKLFPRSVNCSGLRGDAPTVEPDPDVCGPNGETVIYAIDRGDGAGFSIFVGE
jgi:hypothetical protein